jgi:hypothetical protein
MKFNWGALLSKLVYIPYIVAGIQALHAEAPGATKKQLALDSLGLATQVAGAVDPGDAAMIQASSNLASAAIDQTVALFHQQNVPGFGTNAAPAPTA